MGYLPMLETFEKHGTQPKNEYGLISVCNSLQYSRIMFISAKDNE